VLGIDVTSAAEVRRRIGVVFQSPSLDKRLTVGENLLHHGHLYGMRGAALRARIAEMLARFGLADRAGDAVERLSGGLARRTEIAKGLLHSPELLILDEPSTGLDPGARRDLWDLLRGLTGMTVLLTTHLMDEAERCGRVAILNEGRIVAMGTPDALRAEIGGDVVTVKARDAERLAARTGGRVVDGTVQIEAANGAEEAARILREDRDDVESVTVGRPTLEDVFVKKTGHRFWSA
jgi:ABC-2 type transport system ATP-binding protein